MLAMKANDSLRAVNKCVTPVFVELLANFFGYTSSNLNLLFTLLAAELLSMLGVNTLLLFHGWIVICSRIEVMDSCVE